MSVVKPTTKMQWTVIIISGLILCITVVANICRSEISVEPAFYLFTAISGLTFGASIFRNWKE